MVAGGGGGAGQFSGGSGVMNYYAVRGGNGGPVDTAGLPVNTDGNGVAGIDGRFIDDAFLAQWGGSAACHPKLGAAATYKGIRGKDGTSTGFDGEGRGGGGGGFKGGEAIDVIPYKTFTPPGNPLGPPVQSIPEKWHQMLTGSGAGGSNHYAPSYGGKNVSGKQDKTYTKNGPGFAIVEWGTTISKK